MHEHFCRDIFNHIHQRYHSEHNCTNVFFIYTHSVTSGEHGRILRYRKPTLVEYFRNKVKFVATVFVRIPINRGFVGIVKCCWDLVGSPGGQVT